MYVHVWAHQQVTQQQATSISIPRTVTLLLTTGIRNPPGIPIFLVLLPPPPSAPLHPLSPLPRQVSPMRHQQYPSHSTLKSARGSQLSLTVRENGRHPEDQTFEMYRDSAGKISVGREEATLAVISLSLYPYPTSHNETKCIISPKNTSKGYNCSPFKSCSVKPTL